MSPVAAGLAALLHATVALAFLWEMPRIEAESAEHAIEFTVDAPAPEPAENPTQQAAAVAPPPAAAQPPSAPPVPPPRPLGLAPPRSLTPDANSRPDTPPGPASSRPTRTTEPAREPAREPAKPEPPKPEPQQAAAAPPPPPPPPPPEIKLEQAMPPLEAPPPPLSARDFPKIAPPPPPKAPPPPPPPPQRAQAPPPPPQRQPLQPSPLAGGQQQRAPADSQAAAQPAPSPLTNPASQYGQRKAEEDYLWRVAQKLSQHQQFVKNVSTESGSVVVRLTIARDGTLIDVSMFKSSGLPTLDATALSMIRQASPYPPFPPDITGARQNFLLPLQFRRSD